MSRRSVSDRLLTPPGAALAAALPAALAGDVAGVHRARVASRRLREVLPVVTHGTHGREARRAVRRVTRALGPVRELDVSQQVCVSITVDRPVGTGAQSALDHALRTARAAAQRSAVRALTPVVVAQIGHAIDAVLAASGPSRREVASKVADRLVRRAGGLEAALAHLGTLYSAERLHAVRIAAKQLRYTLEVAGALRLQPTAADRRVLSAAQDLLGRAHDLHVLGGLVRRVEARVVMRSRRASRDLRGVSGEIEGQCRALHGRFLGQRRALAALAARLARAPRRRATARITRPAA